jgi:hypothetical protein
LTLSSGLPVSDGPLWLRCRVPGQESAAVAAQAVGLVLTAVPVGIANLEFLP